jgi:uncharacterized protein with HEPN domain
MRRRDKEFLLDILEACKRIKKYLRGLTYEEFLIFKKQRKTRCSY